MWDCRLVKLASICCDQKKRNRVEMAMHPKKIEWTPTTVNMPWASTQPGNNRILTQDSLESNCVDERWGEKLGIRCKHETKQFN
jgi:hypothetical protein